MIKACVVAIIFGVVFINAEIPPVNYIPKHIFSGNIYIYDSPKEWKGEIAEELFTSKSFSDWLELMYKEGYSFTGTISNCKFVFRKIGRKG